MGFDGAIVPTLADFLAQSGGVNISKPRPHLRTMEEIVRNCVPGLLEVLRREGAEDVRSALWASSAGTATTPCLPVFSSISVQAKRAAGGASHSRASRIAAETYERYGLERYHLTKGGNEKGGISFRQLGS